jgi:hypothetical protein
MMVLFFHAARLAMVVFDPYLSSRPLAEALLRAPEGKLISGRAYYTFSSIFFYTNRTALILNGRFNNLEYGSYAPGAPSVFIEDAQFKELWLQPERYYLVALDSGVPALENLVGRDKLNLVASSGGKSILTNHPLAGSVSSPQTGLMLQQGIVSTIPRAEMAFWPTSLFAACFGNALLVEKNSLVPLTRVVIRDGFFERRGDRF